jgi:hypothetical protein
MGRNYYEEEQSLKDNHWIWVLLLAITLGALLPVVYGIYWQIFKGQPWGDESMSNYGAIIVFIFLLFCCVLMNWVILSMKLHLKVDTEGVHYKFFPEFAKWIHISKEEIADYKIEKTNFLKSLGHRRHKFKKGKSINVNGSVLLFLRLTDGKELQLGSRDPEGLESAMKKLFSSREII